MCYLNSRVCNDDFSVCGDGESRNVLELTLADATGPDGSKQFTGGIKNL
jgi:hypothetical protein